MAVVSVEKVSSAIGTAITPEIAAGLDESYRQFVSQFDPEKDDAKNRLSEMVALLEVTEANLKEVQNQGWFKRGWSTISGKNRGLVRVNEANLAKVQAGSVYFLERLAAQNQLSMRSVAFALKRLEDLQISNEKLKGYLLRAVDGYNRRIQRVESEVHDHGKRIEHLEGNVRHWPSTVAGLCLILFGLAAASIPLFRGNSFIWGAPGILIVIGGLLLILRHAGKLSASEETQANQKLNELSLREARQALAIRNTDAAKRLREKAAIEFKEGLLDATDDILEPFGEFWSSLPDVPTGDPTREQRALWMDGWLSASPLVGDHMASASSEVAERVCNTLNAWMSALIHGEGLNDMPGVELKIHLGHDQQIILRSEFISTLGSIQRNLNELELGRQKLKASYPRYRKLVVEHPAKAVVKGFLKGLLILPALLDDESEFVGEFEKNLESYAQSIDHVANQVTEGVDPLLKQQLGAFLDRAASRLEALAVVFTDEQLELGPILEKEL